LTTRTIIRTPRKRKFWAVHNEPLIDMTDSDTHVIDILDNALTDVGLTNFMGMTEMRCIGRLVLNHSGTEATTPIYQPINVGLAWLSQDEAALAGTPKPLLTGTRETEWIQQWNMGATEAPAGAYQFSPLVPIEMSVLDFDVTQMRKQPAADHRLCLVTYGGSSWESGTVDLHVITNTLVALP